METTTNKEVATKKGERTSPAATRASEPMAVARKRETLALDLIDFNERNRTIDENSDSFRELVDSVRAFGVIHAPQVQVQADGRYQLHDGERRIRAACAAGIKELACDVWPAQATAEVILASFVVQQHHKPHAPLEIARRLRTMKHEYGLTNDQLAAKTGIPVDRIETYRMLLQGSEDLLSFFHSYDVPLKTAAAMVRYELETSEHKSRQLIARYKERPLTRDEIVELRKREKARASGRDDAAGEAAMPARTVFSRAFAVALKKDSEASLPALVAAVEQLGYRLVPADGGRPRAESGDASADAKGAVTAGVQRRHIDGPATSPGPSPGDRGA
jgi:hypothetical protein